MLTKCYIVEICSDNETMFEQLDEYGFDYWSDVCCSYSNCIEIYIDCYPHEVTNLESIMKWYV